MSHLELHPMAKEPSCVVHDSDGEAIKVTGSVAPYRLCIEIEAYRGCSEYDYLVTHLDRDAALVVCETIQRWLKMAP